MESRSCIIMPLRKGREKLAGTRGVSLAEMLLCVLILLLSTGVTVSTLDLGIRHFQARTRESEQRLLCDTLSLAVQEYLTYAYKVELDESGKLARFRTGALGALYDIPCEFVTGTYYSKDRLDPDIPDEGELPKGEIAIKYSKSGEAQYYPLADKSLYIVKKLSSTRSEVKLEATQSVTADRVNKRFRVKIVVSNKAGGTGDAENEFIVIPVNQSVIPD